MRGERIGGKVRQVTVLNLGRSFAVAQPRSVGIEQVGLAAVTALGWVEKLTELGRTGRADEAPVGTGGPCV